MKQLITVLAIMAAFTFSLLVSSIIAQPTTSTPSTIPSTTTIIAVGFCTADTNGDCKVDLTDLVTMKSEFFSSGCEACSPPYPAPVPKTGQITSYGNGDDGELEKGVDFPNPRFTDNLDGTVTDNLTGLIWLKEANCFGSRTWNNALSDCNGLSTGVCGLTDNSQAGDWRLPNYKELFSLVDANNYDPTLSLGHPFTNVQSYYYWSSTTRVLGPDVAWHVDMYYGFVFLDPKTNLYYVWPVRNGHQGSTTTTTSSINPLCDESTDCGEGYCCGYASVNEVESGDPLYCTSRTNDAICFFCESQSDCSYSTVYNCCCSECPTVLPPASFCINPISCVLGCDSTCLP